MKNILLLFSILYLTRLTAQDNSIVVEVSPESVLMDNEFEVSFTVENAEIKSFEAPAFKDFELLGGPMTSSMMQIINGSITSRQTYTYILAPKNPGKFYIEPAFANLKNGSVLETQAIEIVVKSNPDGIKQDRNRSNNSLEDMFRRPKTQKPAEKLKPERKTYKI
jgi:hypothetical protein